MTAHRYCALLSCSVGRRAYVTVTVVILVLFATLIFAATPSSETSAGEWAATLARERSAWWSAMSTSPSGTSRRSSLRDRRLLRCYAAPRRRRSHLPRTGGRATDPRWTERRLVPLAPETLKRLEDITSRVREHGGVNVEPMQLAGLLLEKTARQLSEAEAEKLVRPRRRASR